MEMERLTVRLNSTDLAALDGLRGTTGRSVYLRQLVRAAARSPDTSPPPGPPVPPALAFSVRAERLRRIAEAD
jgi:hypothetical protein